MPAQKKTLPAAAAPRQARSEVDAQIPALARLIAPAAANATTLAGLRVEARRAVEASGWTAQQIEQLLRSLKPPLRQRYALFLRGELLNGLSREIRHRALAVVCLTPASQTGSDRDGLFMACAGLPAGGEEGLINAIRAGLAGIEEAAASASVMSSWHSLRRQVEEQRNAERATALSRARRAPATTPASRGPAPAGDAAPPLPRLGELVRRRIAMPCEPMPLPPRSSPAADLGSLLAPPSAGGANRVVGEAMAALGLDTGVPPGLPAPAVSALQGALPVQAVLRRPPAAASIARDPGAGPAR